MWMYLNLILWSQIAAVNARRARATSVITKCIIKFCEFDLFTQSCCSSLKCKWQHLSVFFYVQNDHLFIYFYTIFYRRRSWIAERCDTLCHQAKLKEAPKADKGPFSLRARHVLKSVDRPHFSILHLKISPLSVGAPAVRWQVGQKGNWVREGRRGKRRERMGGAGSESWGATLCPAETLKSWRYGGCLRGFFFFFFLEGIESIEIAFFQQANFMGILKRNILWWESKALDGLLALVPFLAVFLSLSSVVFYSP